MIPRRKIKAGQTGNWDTHPYVRSKRVVLRVSPEELLTLEKHRKVHRFDNLAQYLRTQGLKPTPSSTERKTYTALVNCTYQLNKIGVNVNQIARHLNQGAPMDEEVRLVLNQIQEVAHELLKQAKMGGTR
jgi:Bacterial mobilisation protein (MobC)